jgi:nicotinamide-nucleotide amidase
MQARVKELAEKLKSRAWKVATAESCTGGGLAYRMTSLAGSSEWFERGFVTYSNAAKLEMLGVKLATLDTRGAVSPEVAREMAEGARQFSAAQITVAITGIAGPAGGTPDKPVGTVCFAWACSDVETYLKTEYLSGSRAEIRTQSIIIALDGLVDILKK